MFLKDIKRLKEQFGLLDNKVDNLINQLSSRTPAPETIDCETCGCMVRKEVAVRGESVVKIEPDFGHFLCIGFIEKLHTPYYCKRCAPKKKEAKKK